MGLGGSVRPPNGQQIQGAKVLDRSQAGQSLPYYHDAQPYRFGLKLPLFLGGPNSAKKRKGLKNSPTRKKKKMRNQGRPVKGLQATPMYHNTTQVKTKKAEEFYVELLNAIHTASAFKDVSIKWHPIRRQTADLHWEVRNTGAVTSVEVNTKIFDAYGSSALVIIRGALFEAWNMVRGLTHASKVVANKQTFDSKAKARRELNAVWNQMV